jgi:hypothetical protein
VFNRKLEASGGTKNIIEKVASISSKERREIGKHYELVHIKVRYKSINHCL